MVGLMVQAHQLPIAEWQQRVCLAKVVDKLDLVYPRCQIGHHGTNLSPSQPLIGQIFQQGNDR